MNAAGYGYEKGVEILLNAAADVNIQNSYGDTALHYAADKGHLAVCKILLASGAQASVTNSYGRTPFDDALNNGHHEVCELLRTRMDSDPPTTQEIAKPQPHKTHRSNILPSTIKPRRGILPSIASLGRYFNKLLLPDRAPSVVIATTKHNNPVQLLITNMYSPQYTSNPCTTSCPHCVSIVMSCLCSK